jgi:hypothetical protein
MNMCERAGRMGERRGKELCVRKDEKMEFSYTSTLECLLKQRLLCLLPTVSNSIGLRWNFLLTFASLGSL